MKVNNLDLQALLTFEAQVAATGTASITAVPEPPAGVLMAFGILAVLACQKLRPSMAGYRFLVGHVISMYSKRQCLIGEAFRDRERRPCRRPQFEAFLRDAHR